MPTRQQQRRVHSVAILFSLAFGGMMVLSYVMIAVRDGLLVPKAHLIADFRDAGSIGKHTEVQLAGKKIGKVVDVEFITQRYACDPRTEDFGHAWQGRTDACEPWMFCAVEPDQPNTGSCAELEVYSGHASEYQGCDSQASCKADEVCVTQAFRHRYRDVRWWGQAGWCVKFDAQTQRIRVDIEIDESALQYIRTDSRASIVLNGILADPRVNITVGSDETWIGDGGRIQTVSSLMEDALGIKDQIDRIADDVDRGLIGVSSLTDVLDEEATKADLAKIKEHMTEIQRQVRDADGLVGAVLNDPDTRTEISRTLRDTRTAIAGAEVEYDELAGKAKRTMAEVEQAGDQVSKLLDGLADPKNPSLAAQIMNEDSALRADASRLADQTQEAIGASREAITDMSAVFDEIIRAVDDREGSLGRLIADPKPLYHIKDPATLRRVNVVKGLVRWVIRDDPDSVAVPRARVSSEDQADGPDADPAEPDAKPVGPGTAD